MRRNELWILGAMVAVGAIARFATLDLQSFHHDEAVTAGEVIQPGLRDTLREVVDGERSPPLYYLFAWVWAQPFGTGEVGLRSLSAVLGTLMIPAAFLAGRQLASNRAGLYAAALVALNPLLVYYSQEARSYILAALLVTLALAFLARSLRRPDGLSLALFAACGALAIASHYFAGFVIAPMAAWLLYRMPRSYQVRAALAGLAVAVAALLPLALVQQGEDRRDGFTDLSLPGRVAEVGLDYMAGEDPDPLAGSAKVDAVQLAAGIGGGLLLLVAAALAVRRGTREEQRALWLTAAIAAVGVGVPALMAVGGLDFLKPRNAMAGVVLVLVAAAVGFAARGVGRLGLAGVTALCALFGGVVLAAGSTAEMQREDWRGVAEAIGQADEPRLLAVPQNGDDPLLYYLDAQRFVGPAGREGAMVAEVVVVATTAQVDLPDGFEVAERHRLPPLFDVWELRADGPRRVVRSELERVLRERSTVLLEEP